MQCAQRRTHTHTHKGLIVYLGYLSHLKIHEVQVEQRYIGMCTVRMPFLCEYNAIYSTTKCEKKLGILINYLDMLWVHGTVQYEYIA